MLEKHAGSTPFSSQTVELQPQTGTVHPFFNARPITNSQRSCHFCSQSPAQPVSFRASNPRDRHRGGLACETARTSRNVLLCLLSFLFWCSNSSLPGKPLFNGITRLPAPHAPQRPAPGAPRASAQCRSEPGTAHNRCSPARRSVAGPQTRAVSPTAANPLAAPGPQVPLGHPHGPARRQHITPPRRTPHTSRNSQQTGRTPTRRR
ncbi:MAG: hypothetical protein RL215_3015 [Planctomycetota bacterium]|jgi:hypothetical protein